MFQQTYNAKPHIMVAIGCIAGAIPRPPRVAAVGSLRAPPALPWAIFENIYHAMGDAMKPRGESESLTLFGRGLFTHFFCRCAEFL